MKLTYEVPGILIDNTKTETIYELINKASSSLSVTGSFLVSDGCQEFVVIKLSDVTGSLVHYIQTVYPLEVNSTPKYGPTISLEGIVPIIKGGTGKSSVEANKLLAGGNNAYRFVNISADPDDPTIEVLKDPIDGDILIQDKLFNTSHEASTFLASLPNMSSVLGYRNLVDSDIPDNLTNKNLEGGSHIGGTFSGSYTGDGTGLININVNNFAGVLPVSKGGTGVWTAPKNGIFMGKGPGEEAVKFFYGGPDNTGDCLVWDDVQEGGRFEFAARATLGTNTFSGHQHIVGGLSLTGVITGSGAGLTDLSSSLFNDFAEDVYRELKAGDNISIELDSDRKIFITSSGGLTSVATDGVIITGSGTPSNPIGLNQNISFSTDLKFAKSDFVAPNILSIGHVIALDNTFQPPNEPPGFNAKLNTCNKNNELKSKVVGIISKITTDDVYIATSGKIKAKTDNTSLVFGDTVYVYQDGKVDLYSTISTGDNITQVGFVFSTYNISDSTVEIILQPRIFGQA